MIKNINRRAELKIDFLKSILNNRSQQIEATNERKQQWLLFQRVERLRWRNEALTRKEQQGGRRLMRRWKWREGTREVRREREREK